MKATIQMDDQGAVIEELLTTLESDRHLSQCIRDKLTNLVDLSLFLFYNKLVNKQERRVF